MRSDPVAWHVSQPSHAGMATSFTPAANPSCEERMIGEGDGHDACPLVAPCVWQKGADYEAWKRILRELPQVCRHFYLFYFIYLILS
jgi:hypothetical protein